MKCANCGNKDPKLLTEKNGLVYCMKCTHRTRLSDGKDDSVECPYCHRMRDRTATYCRYCNSSDWKPSTKKQFAEIDSLLKKMGY